MNFFHCQVIGILGSSKTYVEETLPSVSCSDCEDVSSMKGAKGSSFNWMKNSKKRSDNLSQGKVDQLSTRNESEALKRTLSLSKTIFRAGSLERSLRRSFSLNKEERLSDAYSCDLFTTAGPIRGKLFITSERIAFHSKKSLKLSASKGEVAKVPYKVSIPLGKVKNITSSEHLNKPEEKYVQIVTVDDFEFWFTGFVNYKKSFQSLFLALSEQQ